MSHHTNRLVTILFATTMLSQPLQAQGLQSPALRLPGAVQLASTRSPARLNLTDASTLADSAETLLRGSLSAGDLDRIMGILRGPDTGARAATYAELVAQLPTSAATIARLFGRISPTEGISAARLQQDLMAKIAATTGGFYKSTQAGAPPTSLGGGAAAGAGGAAALGGAGVGLAAAGLALALGGGGLGGSSCGTTCDAFGTEYDAQFGLGLINAKTNNDAGNTGSGIRVAVVDTGIDASHSEFSGRTINGVDFAGAGGFNTDTDGHGTHVASTIGANRDMVGMRGVAYEVDLYSYKIFTGSFSFSDSALAGLYNQHVTDSIRVSNNSWGFNPSIPIDTVSLAQINAALPQTLAALAAAQTAGTVFVWANGNSAQAQPDLYAGLPYRVTSLAPQWLSVTAVDSTKTEASFTNRCGVAWDSCVTAPGVSIYAAMPGGGYQNLSGTSMAAPHVAGLVALLMDEFPSLTPAQIVTRLKSTATYDGLTGRNGCTSATCTTQQMREIFGHGLVNQQAATAVVGTLNYTTSENIYTGPSVDLSGGAPLSMPAGLGGAALASIESAQFAAFDTFDGATFAVPGSQIFSSNPASGSSVGYASLDPGNAASDRVRSLAVLSDGRNGLPAIYMSQSTAPADVASVTVWGDKASLLPTPGFIKEEATQRIEMVAAAGNGLRVIPYVQVATGARDVKNAGFGVNMVFDLDRDTRLVASLGRNDTTFDFDLYGGAGQQASVDSLELGFSTRIGTGWEAFGRVSRGYTAGFDASTTNWGLDDASFSRATFGMEYKARSGAQFAFGLVNDGNFDSGTVSIVAPTGRQSNGAVVFSNQSFNAASPGAYAPFMAAKLPVDIAPGLPGTVTFSVQQEALGGPISKADLSLSVRF